MGSSKLMVTSLSCAELGTAQPQFVGYIFQIFDIFGLILVIFGLILSVGFGLTDQVTSRLRIISRSVQDPQELYNFIRYLTGPGKTLWTIHKHRRLYKTFCDHTELKRTIS